MSTTAEAATGRYSVFNAMVDIIAQPSRALDEVKKHPRWFWWPLLLSLALGCAAFAYYTNWVDFEWMVDEVIRGAIAQGTPADQAESIRAFMNPGMQMWSSVIGIVVVTFLIYAIQATYLHLVNKTAGDPSLGWGQWFSFSAWTAFVGIFASIAMFIVMFLADNNQVAQHDLMPLSMNSLFMHQSPGDPWFTWGNSLNLLNIWMLVLMAIGYHRWTGASMVKSAIVTSTPWVLIFGIWAALIAF